MHIKKILYKNNWININNEDYEIKMLELKKGRPTLHLIYNNTSIIKIAYECSDCKKIIETSWKKYKINQYDKNKCLCQKCSMKQASVKELISEKTKQAMQDDKVKQKCKDAQKKRWENINEREKRSKISKEIIQRDNMKELISKRTKEEMNKYNTKKLCNPYKNMNELEKKQYLYKVGKSISKTLANNPSIIQNAKINRKNTIKNNKYMQDKIINATVHRLLNNSSQIQKFISNYVNVINKFNLKEEYAINLYNNENYNMSFLIVDFANEELKIGIEVLGNYYHDGMIEFLNGKDIYDIRKNASEFKLKKLERDLEKDKYFKENGWNILYITEDEIFKENWMLKINNFFININYIS